MLLLQVEKAPVTVKTGLKKEEAEELKKKLEAGTALLLSCTYGVTIKVCI